MRKFWLFLLLLPLSTALLYGRISRTPQIRPIVTQVDVYTQHNGQVTKTQLTDTEDMEAILNYLRATDTHIPAEAFPTTPEEDIWTIHVHRADGSSRVYRQYAQAYFFKERLGWRSIDPEHGQRLFAITEGLQNSIL